MSIKLLEDVGAPIIVTAANIVARTAGPVGTMPMADVVAYGLTGVGYLSAYMGWGGKYNDLLKNIGIAAAPLAFDKLYTMIKGGTASRVGRMTRVSRYPGPASESPFQGVRLV